ncbi:terpene synthase family protein [Streptosporangium soli]|nr:terpene synthase family protein [Streptosporangium sp. KLBMP 9127]
MTVQHIDAGPLTAGQSGAVSAVAGRLQRDMREWSQAYPSLFDAKPFDPALFGTLSLASAFSGPWLSAAELRMANRACLWCFGLDWLVDYVATSPAEVHEIVRRCLAVAGGRSDPDDDLTRFLADLLQETASSPAFPALGTVWHEELERMLAAMAREAEWQAAGTRPSFEEYLANSDNLGFSFVFTTHWIATSPPPDTGVEAVRQASRAVQRVIRLLNDLGTYSRDVSWGDLNALMLGVTREEVAGEVTRLAELSRELIRPLRAEHPAPAAYLERQMDFCAGFYRIADYWGEL